MASGSNSATRLRSWFARATLVAGLFPALAQAQSKDPPTEQNSPQGGDVNSANSPLTPKITVNLQDYFLPSMNRLGNSQANQFLLRGLVPSDAFGLPQLIRFTLPVATTPTVPTGSDTGLGDFTLFDLFVLPTKPVLIATGPLFVAPTASTRALGAGKWQAGAAAAVVAPQEWGLLAGLVTYQHSFAGDDDRKTAQVVTAQPIVTYNLPNGLYLRSTGVLTFDLGNHTSTIPVGLGFGKVWTYGGGDTINAFVEPQYSVIHSGAGVPIWQIFAGINFQFAL